MIKNQVGVWLAFLVLIAFVIAAALFFNFPMANEKEVVFSSNEITHYYERLIGPNSQLGESEKNALFSEQEKPIHWMDADKDYFSRQMPDTVITMYPHAYISIYEGAAITCGQLRFGLGQEALLYFLSSRRAQIALVKGDVHLEDEEFMELFSLVCSEGSRIN